MLAYRRQGVSIIEVMISLTVFALVVALGMVIYQQANRRVAEATVLMEIDRLSQALEQHRQKYGAYPPCFGQSDPIRWQAEFVVHLRRMFPEFAPPPDTPPAQFAWLRQELFTSEYKYLDDSQQLRPLDLNRLDQAEALVFWLAGLPAPSGHSSSSKLFGFPLGSTDPFYLDLEQPRRSLPAGFEFDPARLVDRDNDGWLEYVPPLTVPGTAMPPYVYWDASVYTSTSARGIEPRPGYRAYPTVDSLKEAPAVSDWGLAVPYAREEPGGKSFGWNMPQSFQLLCAGFDARYGSNDSHTLRYFPTARNFDPAGADHDNLTNFHNRPLGEATP